MILWVVVHKNIIAQLCLVSWPLKHLSIRTSSLSTWVLITKKNPRSVLEGFLPNSKPLIFNITKTRSRKTCPEAILPITGALTSLQSSLVQNLFRRTYLNWSWTLVALSIKRLSLSFSRSSKSQRPKAWRAAKDTALAKVLSSVDVLKTRLNRFHPWISVLQMAPSPLLGTAGSNSTLNTTCVPSCSRSHQPLGTSLFSACLSSDSISLFSTMNKTGLAWFNINSWRSILRRLTKATLNKPRTL
jgi:hypothetical protein